nr:MAG TPA: hypothetical protein [Caudoviricetes sp.]
MQKNKRIYKGCGLLVKSVKNGVCIERTGAAVVKGRRPRPSKPVNYEVKLCLKKILSPQSCGI